MKQGEIIRIFVQIWPYSRRSLVVCERGVEPQATWMGFIPPKSRPGVPLGSGQFPPGSYSNFGKVEIFAPVWAPILKDL